MSGRRDLAPLPPRDQERSTFTDILERLLHGTPGAIAAALVDHDGETVDYAGPLDPFDLKVAAAHWQIVLCEVRAIVDLGPVRALVVTGTRCSFVVRCVHEGYAVVLVMHRSSGFAYSERALQDAAARFSAEAGWPPPDGSIRWFEAEVEPFPADPSRPARVRVAGGWQPVEVMGSIVGLPAHERGYRVRLPNGAETILVRERLGRWFSDERIDQHGR